MLTEHIFQVMPKTEIASLTFVQMAFQALLTAPLAKRAGTKVANRNAMLSIGFIMMICANLVFGLPFFAHRWGRFLKKHEKLSSLLPLSIT